MGNRPGHTIPPTPVRLSHNIKQAATLAPGIGSILFPLVAVGWLWALVIPSAPSRRRFRIPPLVACRCIAHTHRFLLRFTEPRSTSGMFFTQPTLYVLVGLAAAGAAHLATKQWRHLAYLKTGAMALGLSMGIALFIRAFDIE